MTVLNNLISYDNAHLSFMEKNAHLPVSTGTYTAIYIIAP